MAEAELLARLPALAFAAVLLFARMGAATMILPGLGESEVPARVRLVLAVALVPLLLPVLGDALPTQPAGVPALVRLLTLEAFTGLWLGGLARVTALALAAGLQVVAILMGLASVLTPDGQMGAQAAVLGRLGSLAAAVLMLSTGLYAVPLQALAGSYAVLPAGAPWPAGAAVEAWLAAGGEMFALALRLAAPFVLAGFLLNLASGLLSRVAPQVQVSVLVAPAQILGGLALLAILAGPMVTAFLDALRQNWAALPGMG